MATLSAFPSCLLAGLLLYAASRKVADSTPLASTLQRIGLPRRFATSGARIAPFFECSAAALLVIGAGRPVGATVGLLAGLTMAAAGILGLVSTTPIPCACFTAGSSDQLGWRQIIVGLCYAVFAVTPWLAGLVLPLTTTSILFVSTAFIVSALNAARAWPDARAIYYGRTARS